MWTAALWGGVSGSAVLIGALLAMWLRIPKRVIGFVMAFGTGVLIGAAAYELLSDTAEEKGLAPTIIGFAAGAIVFTLFDAYISKKGGASRKRSGTVRSEHAGAGLAIFAGTLLDAIPESIMIGSSLLTGEGVSFLLVIAIFLSNIPEGLSSTAGLRQDGYSRAKIALLWLAVVVMSVLASMFGYAFMHRASDEVMGMIASFAGGGIIAMVASSMMPEAYEDGGPLTGLAAAAGLLVSLILDKV